MTPLGARATPAPVAPAAVASAAAPPAAAPAAAASTPASPAAAPPPPRRSNSALAGLVRAASLAERTAEVRPWGFAALAGRLVEASGPGSLTYACRMVSECQAGGEPVCWVAGGPTVFYPPDAAASGVALEALAVVRAPDGRWALRAVDRLLRSRAFGLVVLDLAECEERGLLRGARAARLARLARTGAAALLCLRGQGVEASPFASLRVRSRLVRARGLRWRWTLRPLKDKRLGAGWRCEEVLHGPPGLR